MKSGKQLRKSIEVDYQIELKFTGLKTVYDYSGSWDLLSKTSL